MSEKDYTVPALDRGLKILEMFDSTRRSISQAEMAEQFGVSVNSLYRIVQTLNAAGYLNKVGKTTYELGPQVLSRGFSYLASREIVEVCAPLITRLRDSTSLSSHLSIREGTETLYIFRALALQRVSVNVPLGTRLPCHTNAMGRALLQELSPTQLETLYKGVRLDGYPEPAPRTLPELITLCDREKQQGWSLHYSDYSTAIAVPIRNFTGEVIAAINISGPDVVMHKEGVQERLIKALQSTAREIMKQLGGR